MALSVRDIVMGLDAINVAGKNSRVEITLTDGTVFTAHPLEVDTEDDDFAYNFSNVAGYRYSGVSLKEIKSFRQIEPVIMSVNVPVAARMAV
jgi:hypothetical protein